MFKSVDISTQLTPHLVMYIKRKGPIAGPSFKIPLMGPFLQALNPKFEAYLAQWASGPLSCVSIFHKYVCSRPLSSQNPTSLYERPCSHLILQIRRPRLRHRPNPQGFQVAVIRRAMHSTDRKRHHRPQSMGFSSG